MHNYEGVFTATIDSQQQKVTVTGNVGVETLLRKLVKAGKYAEIWPENLDGKGKNSGKEKKKKKDQNEPKEAQSLQNKGTESVTKCENEGKNKNKKSKTDVGESPEKSPDGNHVPPVSGGGGSDNNKKKKKKDGCSGNGNGNGNDGSDGLTTVAKSGPAHSGFQFQNLGQTMAHQVNLSPTRQQSILYPSETGCYPSMVYMSSAYNRLYPMGRVGDPSYHVPSSPYTCPPSFVDQYGTYQVQSGPLVPFELFSDENANGCSIM